jgi:UDP-sulfoquinovose synthase
MKVLASLVLLPCLATGFTAPSFARVAAPVSSTSLYAANGENGLLEKKKVIVLGGDGFCGWPTSLYLSDQGHDVVIVDNLSRRNIDTELGCDSLTPIQPMEVRWLSLLVLLPLYTVYQIHNLLTFSHGFSSIPT